MYDDNTYTAHRVSVPNAELPVTLELSRAHLRNEDLRYDDEYVKSVIRAAAGLVETQYGMALLNQTVVQYHRSFPCSTDTPLLLRIAPLVSVSSIEYMDGEGNTQTWSSAEYAAGHFNNTAFIIPKPNYAWPSVRVGQPNAVTITYTAGFGAKASQVPDAIRSALLLIIGALYENREDAPSTLPLASENLLRPYYRFSC